jgi:hypothetical protein
MLCSPITSTCPKSDCGSSKLDCHYLQVKSRLLGESEFFDILIEAVVGHRVQGLEAVEAEWFLLMSAKPRPTSAPEISYSNMHLEPFLLYNIEQRIKKIPTFPSKSVPTRCRP